MSNQSSNLKELFKQLTPRQREMFIELLEAYIGCRYVDFQDYAEQLKWDREVRK